MSNNEYPNLALIREGIKFRFPIQIGRLTLEMRPLSTFEEEMIEREVATELSKLPEQERTGITSSGKLSIKKLYRAQTSDIHAKDAKMNELELAACTPAELQFIFKEYLAGCDKVNPRLESYKSSEVTKWVEALKKSSQAETTLIESSFYQLVALCLHLLTVQESPTDSSPG